MIELDPRWEWAEVTMMGDRSPQYIKLYCLHTELVDVTTMDGIRVARLCATCDEQLPP